MDERTVLYGGDIVLYEGVMHDGVVIIENGNIAQVSHISEYNRNDSDKHINCAGHLVCSGFIDIHNQGGGGFSVMEEASENIPGMCKAHAAHGTTGLLLTPQIKSDSFRDYIPKLAAYKGKDTGGAAVLGIHSEGPFTNPEKQGCMPDAAVIAPSESLLKEILDCGDGAIVEMTIAPELPGALDLINTLANESVVPSLGHSNATLSEVLRAVDYGAQHVTHFFNAMSPINHREPGLAGAALFSADLTVEVIADGFHIHPWMLGLTVQNKGVNRCCLITDAMPPLGLEDGDYESLDMKVRLDNGRLSLADDETVLAGSVLSQDRAVGNMVNMVGLSISDAVVMASATPAAILGLDEKKGHIAEGYDADIAILDTRYDTCMTIVGGSIVYDAGTLERKLT